MAHETLEYRNHRLEVSPLMKGWRVMIYPPSSAVPLRESPSTLEKCPKEAMVDEAKKIVDGRLGGPAG
jgi:hypothetical protein